MYKKSQYKITQSVLAIGFTLGLGFSAPVLAANQFFSTPTINSMFVDRCVQGAGWNLFDPKRCDATRKQEVADAFCRSKNFTRAVSFKQKGHVGNHSIYTYRKTTSPLRGSFTQVVGNSRLDDVTCTTSAKPVPVRYERKTYKNPTVSGLRIDKCVQGAGWSLLDPKRCDRTRVRAAASAYCKTKRYDGAESWRLGRHLGNHSIWSYKKGRSAVNGTFTQVAGGDAFNAVTCKRRAS